MENKPTSLDDRIEALHQRNLAAGGVDISPEALVVALDHIRLQKEIAIDTEDFEDAASWRRNEQNILQALGGLGLSPAADYN